MLSYYYSLVNLLYRMNTLAYLLPPPLNRSWAWYIYYLNILQIIPQYRYRTAHIT